MRTLLLLVFTSSSLGCSCGPDAPLPEGAQLLSETTKGKDEDPSLLRLTGGSLSVAYFSERTGNGDIYLRAVSADGVLGGTIQVSDDASPEHYPTLAQDGPGHVHATWFRKVNGRGRLVHAVSRRIGVFEGEVDVTAPIGKQSDWTPAIAATQSGVLVIVFSRDGCFPDAPCFSLQVVLSTDDGVTWSAPAPLHANSVSRDFTPTLTRLGSGIVLTWTRYSATETYPWQSTSSETMVSESPDGVTWSRPLKITDDTRTDVFPSTLELLDGGVQLTWLTSAPEGVTLVSADLDGGARGVALPPTVTGYSHRVGLLADGRPFVVWVQGREGAQRVYSRVLPGR